ncbi:NACHT, LRR and PYD domains-containing protein 3-like isoform X2 [Protopterus annectens]|nr:NACHT, LRR and PYD domains-containing protein 3-like isoform X2 [Protopterus annectens]
MESDVLPSTGSVSLHAGLQGQSGSNQVAPVIVGSNNQMTMPITISIIQDQKSISEEKISSSDSSSVPSLSDVQLKDLQAKHKNKMQHKFKYLTEYSVKPGEQALIIDRFTTLWITDGEHGQVSREHEVWDMEFFHKASVSHLHSINHDEIFNPAPGKPNPPRMVLTKGIAGIGKTVCVQKLVYDWCTGKAVQEFNFIFTFQFRQLNLLPKRKFSFLQIVQQFYPYIENLQAILDNENCKCLFIFDGLDESKLPFDFNCCPHCCKITDSIPWSFMIINIIKGNLVPSASVWVTSRPGPTDKIPSEYIDRITEIQGFEEKEKEEYFYKRCADECLAQKIITHIKRQKTLSTMCYIPTFCWLLATVFEYILSISESVGDNIPKSLSEVYANFLLVIVTYQQCRNIVVKTMNEATKCLASSKHIIMNIGKLAYTKLKKHQVIFYEKDFKAHNLNQDTLCGGFCKEIIVVDSFLLQQKAYSFVHLTMQEYFAALYVFLSFDIKKKNTFIPQLGNNSSFYNICKTACQETISSPDGHMDLFFRFLCGMGAEKNLSILEGLTLGLNVTKSERQKIANFIKNMLERDISPERCMNLLHCLSEIGENSIVDEVKHCLTSGAFATRKLSPSEYSALAIVLQMSDETSESFNLSQYVDSVDGFKRIIPVAKLCTEIRLGELFLSKEFAEHVTHLVSASKNKVREISVEHSEMDENKGRNLFNIITHKKSRIHTLRLQDCVVTSGCAELGSLLRTHQILKTMDLTECEIEDYTPVFEGLKDQKCNIENLRISRCCLFDYFADTLPSALTKNKSLTELDVNGISLKNSGVKLLTFGISDISSIQKLRLTQCSLEGDKLSEKCEMRNSVLILLDLSRNSFGDTGAKWLASALKSPSCNLKTLVLSHNNLTANCCEDLSSAIIINKSLIKINLNNNSLEDSGVKILSAGLQNPNCKLQELKLSWNNLTSNCCADLSAALSVNQSLVKLDLEGNNLKDEGVNILSTGLQSASCRLKKVRLNLNRLTHMCCQALAASFYRHEPFIELDLSCNELLDAGVKFLSEGLNNPNCKLEKLNISGNRLKMTSCEQLCSVLCNNKSLLELDLSGNRLDDSGIKSLCIGLKDPNCRIQKLNLYGTDITDISCKYIASALVENLSLKELNLCNNKFGNTGMKYLADALDNPRCNIQNLKLQRYGLFEEIDLDFVHLFGKMDSLQKSHLFRKKPKEQPPTSDNSAAGKGKIGTKKRNEDSKFECFLIGDGAVGKSTLVDCFMNCTFPPTWTPSIWGTHKLDIQVNRSPCSLKIHDVSGLQEYESIRKAFYHTADVILLVCAISQTFSDNLETYWIPEVRNKNPDVPVILVCNKTDLRKDPFIIKRERDKYNRKPMTSEEGQEMARRIGATKYIECSAIYFEGINNVFEEAVRTIIKDIQKSSCRLCETTLY